MYRAEAKHINIFFLCESPRRLTSFSQAVTRFLLWSLSLLDAFHGYYNTWQKLVHTFFHIVVDIWNSLWLLNWNMVDLLFHGERTEQELHGIFIIWFEWDIKQKKLSFSLSLRMKTFIILWIKSKINNTFCFLESFTRICLYIACVTGLFCFLRLLLNLYDARLLNWMFIFHSFLGI